MTHGQKVTIEFNDKIVRQFMLASLCWGIVGMLVGIVIATQLNYWQANFGQAWLTFGRLRPLHTNAVIFAFVGNMMFAGIYYSTQRLVKARLASDFLSSLHFWGWQLIIVAAAITLPLGLTRGKEYAELIWPINIAVAVIWVVFGCAGSAASFSTVVSSRMNSSCSNVRAGTFLVPGISTGQISSAKRPEAFAAAARVCERSANASISSRVSA